MSVYIKSMEMPKNCDCCDFMTVEGEYGEPSCPFGLIIRCASEKHPHCPLVPVPEHGRLIDADALVHSYYHAPSFPNLCKAINDAPTIIPADPKKEGEG